MTNGNLLHALIHKRHVWQASSTSLSVDTSSTQQPLQRPLSLTVPEIDNALPDGGLRTGAIHEFFGIDAFIPTPPLTIPTLIAMRAYQDSLESYQQNQWHNDSKGPPCLPATVWIGRPCWPTPQFLATTQLNEMMLGTSQNKTSLLNNSLFIDPPSDKLTLWAIETALSSCSVAVVIAACPSLSRTTSQRLANAAKKFGTTALLLRSHKEKLKPSYALSRWEIAPQHTSLNTPHWELRLQRLKGSGLHDIAWQIGLQGYDFFNPSFPSLVLVQKQQLAGENILGSIDTKLLRHG